MTKKQLLAAGFRAAEQFGGNWDVFADLLKIRELNIRSTAAWTRGNNSGNSAYLATQERKSDRCWEHAKRIADKQGWKLAAPGLWWTVRDENGQDITPHID